jgi:hypothetical protein
MIRSVVLPVVLAAGGVLAAPASLSPADIEKATGLQGVHLVPATAKGAVPGRDNYADSTGAIVLWFHEFNAQAFQRAKAQPAKTMSGMEIEPKLFHAAVAGLGDEAFDSPAGATQHALYVRKGQAAFGLIANPLSRRPVTMEQVKALARIVLSRM